MTDAEKIVALEAEVAALRAKLERAEAAERDWKQLASLALSDSHMWANMATKGA